jgi:hypothetical protein
VTRLALALVLALLAATPAAAHERSASWSRWTLAPDGAWVTLRLPAVQATRLGALGADPARLAAYLAAALRLRAGGVVCTPRAPAAPLAAGAGELAFEWRVACGPGPRRLESDLLLDVAPSHLHFAHVATAAGRSIEAVLSDGVRAVDLDAPAPPSLVAAGRLGVAHILSGWDHLAFVLALLLAGGTLRDTARVVTGFTLAHSVTLALATLGWVRPAQAPVEALIGLSIALVAAENCWLAGRRAPALPWALGGALVAVAGIAAAGRSHVPAVALAGLGVFTACHMTRVARAADPLRLRWHAALAFGLLHGFGFAAVLVDAALPPAAVARVLLGFNGGVELGQLAVVACVLPLVRRAAAWRPATLELGSAAVAGAGVFWFVTRF